MTSLYQGLHGVALSTVCYLHLVEAESELVAGLLTELNSVIFSVVMLSEYFTILSSVWLLINSLQFSPGFQSSVCILLFVSVRIVLVRLKFGGAIQSCDCFYYSLPGQVTAIQCEVYILLGVDCKLFIFVLFDQAWVSSVLLSVLAHPGCSL